MIVKLKTPRIAFPVLFTPEQFKGEGPYSYSAKFFITPGSEDDKAIRSAIETVAKEKFQKKWEARISEFCMNKMAYPYMDGNRTELDGSADKWILTAKRGEKNGAPMALDGEGKLLSKDTGVIYSGCYVYSSVEFYAQDTGIRCTLRAVRFKTDGESFSGGKKVDENELDDLVGADADDLS